MVARTRQIEKWNGEFGNRYWERHPTTVEGFDDLRTDQWGTTQSAVMERLLGDLDRGIRILEVGCGIGIQLEILDRMGFEKCYGVDVHEDALERCRRERPELNVIEADAIALPFRNDYFDLVFTNEMLVTVPPGEVDRVMDEIIRCSNEWIWGLEFHANEYTEIEWRGEERMLWKTDFLAHYLDGRDLRVIEDEVIEYQESDDIDRTFLLRQTDSEQSV